MQNLTFTQLTEAEIRSIIQSELSAFFLTNKPMAQSETDEFGGVEFAATVTGLAVSTIYTLTSKREIPHSRGENRKKLVFSRKALEQWMQSERRKTQTEIREEAINYLNQKGH